MRATASGVDRSPRRATAGPPGRARSQKNSNTDSPNRIGTSSSSLRTTNRSIAATSPEGDLSEALVVERPGHVTRDAFGEGDGRLVVDVRDARHEVHDQPVGLLVELGPTVRVGLRLGFVELGEDLLVLEVAELRVDGLEERADEVVRVTEVARPTQQEHRRVPRRLGVEVVRVPRRGHRYDGESHRLQ